MPDGLFVAVVGPSGAGKDTLLLHASSALKNRSDIVFLRRTVTRDAQSSAEDHDTLSPEAFANAENRGEFSLTWSAHGLSYGLPQSACGLVTSGHLVVANVSRTVLDVALLSFRRLAVIEIDAQADVRAQRLAARGRETLSEALVRTARTVPIVVPPGCGYIRIDNSGAIETAVEIFRTHVLDLARATDISTLGTRPNRAAK